MTRSHAAGRGRGPSASRYWFALGRSVLAGARARVAANPGHADAWSDLGLALAAAGNPEGALDAFDRALVLQPSFAGAALSRVHALGALGRADEALRALKPLHARSPDDADTLLSTAAFLIAQGWTHDGTELLLQLERACPRAPWFLLLAARALHEEGDAAPARERTTRAAELVERHDAGPGAGRADWNAAACVADPDATWCDPRLVRLVALAAQHALAAGASARDILADGLGRFPGHRTLLVELARIDAAAGDASGARRRLATALALHGDHHEVLLELGFVHAGLGASAEAEDCFRRAVALRPLFPDLRFHLAMALLEQGRRAEAAVHLRRVLALNPGFGHAALHLAEACLEMDLVDESLATLAAGGCDEWPEAWLLSARAFQRMGWAERARSLARKVLDADPQNAEALAIARG